MNSVMYPLVPVGHDGGPSSWSRFKVCGLIGLLAVSVFLAGCGRRENQTAAQGAIPAAKSTHIVRKSEAQLERAFKGGGETVLSIEDQEGFKQIKPVQNVALTAQPGALKIEAKTDDPSVHLPEFAGGHEIVQVTVESPAVTEMQLFYRLPGQKSFAQPQSEKRPLKAGHNVVYFELPDPSWTGVLRLDPGMVSGVYLIKSVKVKTVPESGTR